MAEPALTLRDHPQIIDLISVLEQSGLQKQKEEVQALVGYIDGMEEKLSQMMDEMKEMRLEVGKLHDKGIRARCSQLADTVEGKVRQTKVMVSTAKENLISSAKQMVQTFREKGRSALCHAAQALHIPSVPVSYTHLTLPTNREGEISVGAASVKKKKKEREGMTLKCDK